MSLRNMIVIRFYFGLRIAFKHQLYWKTFPWGCVLKSGPPRIINATGLTAFRFPDSDRRNRMESAFRYNWTRFLLAFVVLSLSVGAFAQGAGELTGLVTDATGAVVSGVEVKLTNSATGEVRTTTTTPTGNYSFPALPIVGSYTLEISAKGFKSAKVQNVVVSVGTITTRDVKLEVGAATEQVTVEAGQQIIQTEDSSLSTLIDRRVWENMPIEARNA